MRNVRNRRRRIARALALAALTFPLLSTGSCLRIAQVSLADGFFDAVTPYFVAFASNQLGITGQ